MTERYEPTPQTDESTTETTTSGWYGSTRRRDFLKAVGAGALVGTLGATTASAAPEMTDFVETDGTDFVVNGRPIYFNGTNNFWISNSHADRQRVDDLIELFDGLGLDILRTWAHCAGGDGHCIQPELGVYDEAGLQHLDYIVAKAKQHGIRLVLGLADNWDHDGGIPQYVEWIDGLEDRGDFYTMEAGREAYRNHVETILTRTNTITGIEYRNEPAIAMWELCNEPRLESDQAANVDDHHGALHDWFADMSAYIKELDSNHLVSTGAEGFYTREDGENWMYDDWTGSDYIENHSIDTIDACSFHMYPHWWPGLGVEGHFGEDDFVTCVEWITQHVVDAHQKVGKPVYCGEFNVNAEQGLEVRNSALERWYDTFDEYDANAALPWQIVLEDTDDHDGFQLYPSESGHIVEAYGDAVASKTGGSDGGPIADAVSPETLRVGETGEFSAAYSAGGGRELASYEWAFGDGTTGSGELVGHAFDAAGEYEVTLTVTDEGGVSATNTESVTVEGIPENSFVVEGAGRQIHEEITEFHVAYGTQAGDFDVEANVATMNSTDPSAQAGIVALADLEADGAIGAVAVSPSEGTELVRAYDETTATWRQRLRDDRAPPLWLRLERTDDTVTGYASEDGESWTELESGQVDFDEDVFLGLFVSSNSAGDRCTVQFDDVAWLATQEWAHTDVGDVGVSGSATAGTGETGGDGGGGGSDPEPPASPTDVWVGEATETTVAIGWEAVDEADAYRVSLGGSLETETELETGETETTIDGLEPDTAYEIGVSAVADGEESAVEAITASTLPAGGDGPPSIDGTEPADTTGDGLYNDVTGSGETTTTDVTVFFEHVDDPAVTEYPEYYDFDGNGQVTVTDVVDLFESL
ncbi:PKD domain-containing protein [Halomontanus rarus]|uniref:PKD domain-containing protein n=1 Tax=Halomontanus rarus TaxID=3034020 RepID=UPI0023E75D56|nr:PKD domain-containing protein [Halovivax sp. TS33]